MPAECQEMWTLDGSWGCQENQKLTENEERQRKREREKELLVQVRVVFDVDGVAGGLEIGDFE